MHLSTDYLHHYLLANDGYIAALGPDLIEVYNPHANFAPKHRRSQGLPRFGAILGALPFYARTTPAPGREAPRVRGLAKPAPVIPKPVTGN